MSKKLFANFKLEKSFKKRWVAALRSGKYEQAQGSLYDGDTGGFCCLGLMCLLRGASKSAMNGETMPHNLYNFGTLFNIDEAHTDFFEEGGAAWQVPYKGKMRFLTELNDGYRLSFKQIANIIERSVDTY